jgi:ParB/RepB/Spo0J family partition protein
MGNFRGDLEMKEIYKTVELRKIVDGRFYVRSDDKLRELAASIKAIGLRRPPTLTLSETRKGYFEIVSGHRRVHACRKDGIRKIPNCRIIIGESLEIAREALVENLLESHYGPLEEARTYQIWTEKLGLPAKDLAKTINKNETHISRRRSLLNLDKQVLSMLNKGTINVSHAELLPPFPKESQLDLARKVAPMPFKLAEKYLREYRSELNAAEEEKQNPLIPEDWIPKGPSMSELGPSLSKEETAVARNFTPPIGQDMLPKDATRSQDDPPTFTIGGIMLVNITRHIRPILKNLQISPTKTKCQHCNEETPLDIHGLDFSVVRDDLPELRSTLLRSVEKLVEIQRKKELGLDGGQVPVEAT